MALVSVAGPCSRSGKTALAVSLLRAAPPGSAAVKFTTTDDVFERCPRGTPCVVCNIEVPFRVVRDEATLGQPGTDTARLGEACGGRVVWAIARRGAVRPAWASLRGFLEGAPLVVMEGSTIVDLVRPQLLLFVAHPFLPPERWKAGSAELAARADLVVVNRPASERRAPRASVLQSLLTARGRDDLRIEDVTRPLEEWAPDLAARLLAPASLQGATTTR